MFGIHFKPALILLILTSLSLNHTAYAADQTTVYKVIEADGSTSFSDQAQTNAEEIKLKPVTVIPATDITQNKVITPRPTKNKTQSYYQNLSILSPANNSALHSGDGMVRVLVQSEPELRQGDRFELLLDGDTVARQSERTFQLDTVDRGTHSLVIKIIDRNNKTLKSASSTVTVHRPIARPRPAP